MCFSSRYLPLRKKGQNVSEERNKVSVPESSVKHLARNVPVEFFSYCQKIRNRHFPHGIPPHGHNSRVLERMHRNVMDICLSGTGDQEDHRRSFAEKLFDVYVRYEAMAISVDRSISPVPVHERLSSLLRSVERTLEALDDETRDAVVLEMGGYERIEDVPVTKDAFDHATSLAEKVTITRRVLSVAQSQIRHMSDHFDYKRRMITPGKPPTYAFAYAVFALAELFEEYDHLDRPATVNEKLTEQSAHWSENYRYEGPFLDFVEEFFRKHNPLQIEDHVGTGFANAVRKVAQKRNKAPELHKVLEGEAGAQAVVDFMSGLDNIR